MAKHNLSSQDVRNKLLQLRDSLVQNLEFIQECIDADYAKLKAYYEKYGDLQYRPVLSRNVNQSVNHGEPTELVIEPLAGKYRATINSLLQSIRLIESEILPEDNPEGSTAASNSKPEDLSNKRASLRDQFKAQGEQPTIEAPNYPIMEDVPTKPQPDTTKAKPWRGKQSTFVPSVNNHPERKVVEEPIAKPVPIETKPLNLSNPEPMDAESERLRAELNSLKGGTNSRMSSMREKYGKKK